MRPRPESEIFGELERNEINRIGAKSGCHSCGIKEPGTLSGNWIADIHPPSALNWSRKSQRLFPHCLRCKKMQGLALHALLTEQARADSIRRAPPNSVVFVSGMIGAQLPELDRPGNVWWSDRCVVVGCLSFMDGEISLAVTQTAMDRCALALAYEGVIDTPSCVLIVSTSEREVLLQCNVPSVKTHLRIWTNHPTEPDDICIDVQSDSTSTLTPQKSTIPSVL